MLLIAVDPGSEKSAVLWFDTASMAPRRSPDGELSGHIMPNDPLLGYLEPAPPPFARLIIEMPRLYGAGGNELRDTLVWTGRFIQAWGGDWTGIERQDVFRYLLGKPTGSDPQVRAALIDRYGGKAKAIGKKACPGPLYGIKSHLWAAVAVAVTYCLMQQFEKEAGA